MSAHSAQVPEFAASYFARIGVTDHPTIEQVYRPGVGWIRVPGFLRISRTKVRRLRRNGHTHVALRAGGRTADFTLRELDQCGIRLADCRSFFEALIGRSLT